MSTRSEFVPTKIWVERAAPIVEQVSQLRPYANKLSAELFTKQLLDVVVRSAPLFHLCFIVILLP